MIKRIICILLILSAFISLCSCDYIEKAKKLIYPDTTEEQTEPVTETQQAVDTMPPVLYTDPLTGEPSVKDLSMTRPIAVMIKNDKNASPQFGLSKAAIVYEASVEGGLTRLLAVYSDKDSLAKVGPVIDSRSYFFDFAANHNAIFAQAGSTTEGNKVQVERGITAVDAIVGELDPGFYRDPVLAAERGYESSILTDAAGITARIKSLGISSKSDSSFREPYKIVDYLTNRDMSEGRYCVKLTIPYSSLMNIYFTYSTLTNSYSRFQYDAPHIDASTGTQLRFTNLIVLMVNHDTVNFTTGEMSIDSKGSGTGYYVYGGSYLQIVWRRNDAETPIMLYEKDGVTPLSVSSGNTYIGIASTRISGRILFE